MSFSDEQTKALSAPLHASNIKTREQAGRKLSYVEGWHAIAEANRIFGFDAWTRETFDVKCVSENKRMIGRKPNEREGWGVSYIAKVRVTVEGVVREGIGAGHGIDADLGLAHESAIKEAETDAMKRALMTFGNPFGLALYDKEQAHVLHEAAEPPGLTESESKKTRDIMIAALGMASTGQEVKKWLADNDATYGRLLPADQHIVMSEFNAKVAQFKSTKEAA
jgi:DNA recombination protein Rad52